MNLTSLVLLVLFPVLGGVIAYFADRLGRTLGKKRLSLFGLRPRHTAAVLTVGAGVLVPILTICTILLASSDVRQWVMEGTILVKQRDVALQDIKKLESNRKETERSLSEAQGHLKTVQSDLKSTSERFKSLNNEFKLLTTNYRNLTSDYKVVANDFFLAKSRLASLEGRQRELNATYNALNTSFKELTRQQKEQQEENLKLIAENDIVSKEVASSKQSITEQKAEFDRQAAENKRAVKKYEDDIVSAQKELSHSLNDLFAARFDLNRMRLLRDQSNQELSDNLEASRFRPIIFNLAEEVARIAMPSNLNDGQAQSLLSALLAQASDAAIARGAQPRPASALAVALFPLVDDAGHRITTEEMERVYASQLAGKSENQVVIVNAAANSFLGESVKLTLRRFANPVVYQDRQTIAITRINGRLPEREIFQKVNEFLKKDVYEKAVKDNIILVASSREPAIQVTMAEIIDLVRLIKFQNRPLTLFAEADGETRAAGPLKLQFRLP